MRANIEGRYRTARTACPTSSTLPKTGCSAPFDHRTLLPPPELPGVLACLDAAGNVLYVGKARRRKKRVASYFRENHLSPRIALALVQQIAKGGDDCHALRPTPCCSRTTLIKGPQSALKQHPLPRRQVLSVHPDDGDEYPRIITIGAVSIPRARRVFPAVSVNVAVRESVHLLQRMFRLRTCEDSVFFEPLAAACSPDPALFRPLRRSDQAGRLPRTCALPAFPAGAATGGHQAIDRVHGPAKAAAELAFEQAAVYRDQIASLRRCREAVRRKYARRGSRRGGGSGRGGMVCVELSPWSAADVISATGRIPGGQGGSCTPEEALNAFLEQHYLDHPIPGKILVNLPAVVKEALEEVATAAGHRSSRTEAGHVAHGL